MMRSLFRRLSAAGLPLLFALPSTAPAEQAEDRVREVERLERQLVDAIARTDLATYDRIVADDYVAFEASGKETPKAEILSSYRSGARRYSRLEIFDVRGRVFGDTAVVRARTKGFRREGDRDVPNRVRYIRVYARRAGRWRAVAQMSTPLPELPPEDGQGGPAAPGPTPAATTDNYKRTTFRQPAGCSGFVERPLRPPAGGGQPAPTTDPRSSGNRAAPALCAGEHRT